MIGQYSQYLKFFDMRFSNRGGDPFPTNCFFTIGGGSGIGWAPDYDSYTYINPTHATQAEIDFYLWHSNANYGGGMHPYLGAYMNWDEIEDVMLKYYGSIHQVPIDGTRPQRITYELLQYEIVQKIHADMVSSKDDPSKGYTGYHLDQSFLNPSNFTDSSNLDGLLFPYGTSLDYGLEIDLIPHDKTVGASTYLIVGDKKRDENLYYYDTNPVKDYQRGLTVFRPASGFSNAADFPGVAMFNLNSPAVREYMVQNIVEAGIWPGSINANRVYIDNVSVDYSLVNYRGVEHEYTYKRDWSQTREIQRANIVRHFARQWASIIIEAQERYFTINNEYMDLMQNGLYFDVETHYRDYFLEELYVYAGSYLNGGTCETYISCNLVEKHIARIDSFASNGKKMCYLYNLGQISTNPPNGPGATYEDFYVYRMFLFFHLIAQDNTYFYVGPNYESSSFNSLIFDFPLGNPIDEVAYYDEEREVWKRMYEMATVVFKPGEDVIGSILNPEHIWLEDNVDLEKIVFHIEQIIERIRMVGI